MSQFSSKQTQHGFTLGAVFPPVQYILYILWYCGEKQSTTFILSLDLLDFQIGNYGPDNVAASVPRKFDDSLSETNDHRPFAVR